MASDRPVSNEEAQAAADVLLPLIRRVSPGALERAEVVEQSGLETDEIRDGIALLLEQRKIEDTDDGYRVLGAASLSEVAAGAAETEPTPEADGDGPVEANPASPASVPGSAQSYRAKFDVSITYGGTTRDEAAVQQAAAMEEEIANLLAEHYPNAVLSVEVARIEAYKPRPIFDRDQDTPD